MNQPLNHVGSSESPSTRNIGPSVRVLQLNIEGTSKSKCEVLARLAKYHNVDVIAVQETHTGNEDQFSSRGHIEGYNVAGVIYHGTYGSATYVRSDIDNWSLVKIDSTNNIHLIEIIVGNLSVINVYKPPNANWISNLLPKLRYPSLAIGDFNSHHQNWNYADNDDNGLKLLQWADTEDLELIHDSKDKPTFHSARWKRGYNPDLCFAKRNEKGRTDQINRKVLSSFPRSQHRPVYISIGIQIPLVKSVPKNRWNFKKANWTSFSKNTDEYVRWIPPTVDNYDRFTRALNTAAGKSIPRGYRTEYIPGWNAESDRLFAEFETAGDMEVAEELIQSLDDARREKWRETVENIDFKKSSRKAWSLLRRLGSSSHEHASTTKVATPNSIANRIVSVSRAPLNKDFARKIRNQLTHKKRLAAAEAQKMPPFTETELTLAISSLKTGKAAGLDTVYPEFIKYCGKRTVQWLLSFYNNIISKGQLPKAFKKSKIIAVVKPGKTPDRPEHYRPIALLSICLKVLERLIYNRIVPNINEIIPIEQAGFRPTRSCCDQVLALTSHIECGFEKNRKTAVAFIDLTAAFDTVWRHGLLYKLIKAIPCYDLCVLINEILSNRRLEVHLDCKKSRTVILNNGLPQGSVLAPLLFNLYISDLPDTTARKFCYADDMALAAQHRDFISCENSLNDDLNILYEYFTSWRLVPNPSKTELTTFHLNNHKANQELNVIFAGQRVINKPFSKYLGVTLDRSLTFREHLSAVAGKLRTRNNLIQKLANSSWGADAETLKISALSLVYSVAEYCSPVWLNSKHITKVDTILNHTMRMISGTVKSTPCQWLPVLSNIEPPHCRRQAALSREYRKIISNPALPVHNDIGQVSHRLKSRNPPLQTATRIASFDPLACWTGEWESTTISHTPWKVTPGTKPPGFALPRRCWVTMNRLRTGHGRCGEMMFKWGLRETPECDCGAPLQSVQHIIADCPLRAYPGPISDIYSISPEAIGWMNQLDLRL